MGETNLPLLLIVAGYPIPPFFSERTSNYSWDEKEWTLLMYERSIGRNATYQYPCELSIINRRGNCLGNLAGMVVVGGDQLENSRTCPSWRPRLSRRGGQKCFPNNVGRLPLWQSRKQFPARWFSVSSSQLFLPLVCCFMGTTEKRDLWYAVDAKSYELSQWSDQLYPQIKWPGILRIFTFTDMMEASHVNVRGRKNCLKFPWESPVPAAHNRGRTTSFFLLSSTLSLPIIIIYVVLSHYSYAISYPHYSPSSISLRYWFGWAARLRPRISLPGVGMLHALIGVDSC